MDMTKLSDFAAKAAFFSTFADPGAMVIVPRPEAALKLKQLMEHQEHRIQAAFAPSIQTLSGWAAPMVIIHPEVDIYADIGGHGALLALVRQRTRTFNSPAIIIL
jgi:hypothetical protein